MIPLQTLGAFNHCSSLPTLSSLVNISPSRTTNFLAFAFIARCSFLVYTFSEIFVALSHQISFCFSYFVHVVRRTTKMLGAHNCYIYACAQHHARALLHNTVIVTSYNNHLHRLLLKDTYTCSYDMGYPDICLLEDRLRHERSRLMSQDHLWRPRVVRDHLWRSQMVRLALRHTSA